MPGSAWWRERSLMPGARKYPVEPLERATRLVFESGRPIAHVAADFGGAAASFAPSPRLPDRSPPASLVRPPVEPTAAFFKISRSWRSTRFSRRSRDSSSRSDADSLPCGRRPHRPDQASDADTSPKSQDPTRSPESDAHHYEPDESPQPETPADADAASRLLSEGKTLNDSSPRNRVNPILRRRGCGIGHGVPPVSQKATVARHVGCENGRPRCSNASGGRHPHPGGGCPASPEALAASHSGHTTRRIVMGTYIETQSGETGVAVGRMVIVGAAWG